MSLASSIGEQVLAAMARKRGEVGCEIGDLTEVLFEGSVTGVSWWQQMRDLGLGPLFKSIWPPPNRPVLHEALTGGPMAVKVVLVAVRAGAALGEVKVGLVGCREKGP